MARIYRVLALIAALLCGSPIICARAVRGGIVSDNIPDAPAALAEKLGTRGA